MELLESERRILSPGCCTGEREKKGKEEKGERRELRTMHHAILLIYLKNKRERKKENEKDLKTARRLKRKRESAVNIYTEIKHVTGRRIKRQKR